LIFGILQREFLGEKLVLSEVEGILLAGLLTKGKLVSPRGGALKSGGY
jgi:hypothetical protein